jgi:hypothetical protein
MTSTLKLDPQIFESYVCKSGYFIHVARMLLYQVFIVGGQYSSGLILVSLCIVEIIKIAQAIYCYIKYKYLKNIICLLIDISQSMFLLPFLMMSLPSILKDLMK